MCGGWRRHRVLETDYKCRKGLLVPLPSKSLLGHNRRSDEVGIAFVLPRYCPLNNNVRSDTVVYVSNSLSNKIGSRSHIVNTSLQATEVLITASSAMCDPLSIPSLRKSTFRAECKLKSIHIAR